MIYVVEEQQATWLFASLAEAESFDRQRADEYRYSVVKEYQDKLMKFDPQVPDVPLEFGPGQERCRRIQRKVRRWWKSRDAW